MNLCTTGRFAGQFILDKNRYEYKRIEDKIMFLIAKFGKPSSLDKGSALWQAFENLKKVRNNLIHPRRGKSITLCLSDAENSIDTSKNIIEFMGKKILHRNIKW